MSDISDDEGSLNFMRGIQMLIAAEKHRAFLVVA